MKRVMVFVSLLQVVVLADSVSQVVGFSSKDLRRGWNEITVSNEAFGDAALFTTLDRVGHFSPPEAVIGDMIVFDLDGFHQKYRFTSYNVTNSTYLLTLAMDTRLLPREISLDWIPLPKVFWINHVSTNVVSCMTSGELPFLTARKLEREEQPDVPARDVIIRSVSAIETNLIYTFKGGRIKLEPYVDTRFDIDRKADGTTK